MEKSVKDEDPTEDMMSTYQAKKDRYDAAVKVWSTERKKLLDSKYYVVELINRQCTSGMREALQQRSEYKKVVDDGDVLGLLDLVKTCSLGHRGKCYLVKNAFEDLQRIIDCHQGPREKNGDYRDRMETAILRAEQSGLCLSKAFKFKSQDGEDMSPKETRDRMIATMLISNACTVRYKNYRINLHNDAIKDSNVYPENWAEAMSGLNEYVDPMKNDRTDTETGSSFSQRGKGPDGKPTVAGKDGKTHSIVRCFACNRYGHRANVCPKVGKGEASDEESSAKEKNEENEKGTKKETEETSLQQWANSEDPDDSADDNDEQSLYRKMEAVIAKAGQCHASSARKNDAA